MAESVAKKGNTADRKEEVVRKDVVEKGYGLFGYCPFRDGECLREACGLWNWTTVSDESRKFGYCGLKPFDSQMRQGVKIVVSTLIRTGEMPGWVTDKPFEGING